MRASTMRIRMLLRNHISIWSAGLLVLTGVIPAHADSPWEVATEALRTSFTGPIARSLSLVAIVVGGIVWAFGDGDKRSLAGIVFGVGMAVGAVNFLNWLFP